MEAADITYELKILVDAWWDLQLVAGGDDPAIAVNRLVAMRRLSARGRSAYSLYASQAGSDVDLELLTRVPVPFVPWQPSYLIAG